jgi:hypothetical protein
MMPSRGINASWSPIGSSPSTFADPPSGRRNPSQTCNRLVLPAPLLPSSASTRPRPMLSDTPLTAVVSP